MSRKRGPLCMTADLDGEVASSRSWTWTCGSLDRMSPQASIRHGAAMTGASPCGRDVVAGGVWTTRSEDGAALFNSPRQRRGAWDSATPLIRTKNVWILRSCSWRSKALVFHRDRVGSCVGSSCPKSGTLERQTSPRRSAFRLYWLGLTLPYSAWFAGRGLGLSGPESLMQSAERGGAHVHLNGHITFKRNNRLHWTQAGRVPGGYVATGPRPRLGSTA